MENAKLESNQFPAIMLYRAHSTPAIITDLCVPPSPGYMPIPVSGNLNIVLPSTPILWLQHIANSRPPPNASPDITAIVLILDDSIAFRISCPLFVNSLMSSILSSSILSTKNFMSAPATKAFPDPLSTAV